MVDYKSLALLGLAIVVILYLQTSEDNIKMMKIENEMAIQKEAERTKYLEQTQNNILKAYTLGRQSSCKE